ncbi:AcrR family transcriptional regulator [Thermocatellispora tengchongensis]|uniref:AcrR family transcriptional regulator n=1 Tax=Thermocatellispora tengchongensis TaxID=1073253 RepID=A0A840PNY7_9ACTN|nr:TetR/AcrR family transcriptional regulator [Thermocatellispora tengchongensis]MBB5139763.1 AcrR family transcriptional regulator [Thermocatellispora tengchongensis]
MRLATSTAEAVEPAFDLDDPRLRTEAAQKLMAAARELFVKRGFSATSVSDITERAGMSVGSLYYHYGSKTNLYLAIWLHYQRRQAERARETVHAVRAAGVSNGLRLFLAGTRAYLLGAWEHRDVVRLAADGDTPPGFGQRMRRINQDWLRQNSMLLRDPDALERDDALGVRAVVAIVTEAMGGICREVANCATREEAEELVARAIDVFARLADTGHGHLRPQTHGQEIASPV